MSSKEELERLKKQLKEEEDRLKLEDEIAVIRGRLDKKERKIGHVLKQWLKETGYWNSFVFIVFGIVITEIGLLLMPFPLGGVGVLMILGGAMLTPFLRPFWDSKYKPPRKGS